MRFSWENISGVMAGIGTVAVHLSVAAWAMEPSAPVVLPQQQVIRVAMVTPVVQEQKPTPPAASPAKPKETGMKKAAPQKKTPKIEQKAKQEEKPQAVSASGPQAAQAEAQHAAKTQPTFDADYLQNPPPAYPAIARRQQIEGKVLLAVDVSKEGGAERVMVERSSGSNLLDSAAKQAVERWRFVPARQGKETISATVIVPIIFKLGENS